MQGERANRIAVEKIAKHCEEIRSIYESHHASKEEFDSSIEFQYACGMCIVQIGELVSRLNEDFIKQYSDVPWRQLKGLRNIYAHDYERIDNDMIWETITEDIPRIKEQMRAILIQMNIEESENSNG